MKLILVIALAAFLTCVFAHRNRKENEKKRIISKKKQNGLDQGAGPSTAPDRKILSNEVFCRIEKNSEVILRLMIGRNVNYDGNLTTMVNERLDELEVTAEVYAYLIDSSVYEPEVNYNNLRNVPLPARQEYFEMTQTMNLALVFLEIFRKTHYTQDIRYKVDVNNRTITFLTSRTNKNLCKTTIARNEKLYQAEIKENHKMEVNTTIMTPIKKNKRPKKLIKPAAKENARTSIDNNPRISDHHIIPKKLLEKFFSVIQNEEEEDDSIYSESDSENDCIQAVTLRVENFEKMIVIGTWSLMKKKFAEQGHVIDIDMLRLIDDDYMNEANQRIKCWSLTGGNIFRGPSPADRGPFDPNMRYDEYGFEDDLEPIIGEEHYWISRKIHEILKQFVETEKHSEMNKSEKKRKTAAVINLLVYATENFNLTPYDSDQWEKRLPTEADLNRLKDPKLRKTFENKEYWDIKKPKSKGEPSNSKRPKRSITINKNREQDTQNLDILIRKRLLEFALVSLKDQIKANFRNQSLEWTNDFDNLLDQYLQGNWTNILCINSTIGFADFLYSKMSFQDELLSCIIHQKGHVDEGCLAIRRIILNADSDGKNFWKNKRSRPQQFLKDRTIIWKKLNQIPVVYEVTEKTVMVEKINNFKRVDIHLYNNVINAGSKILPLIQYSPCQMKSLTITKRDILDEFYEREWFLDSDDHLKCF